MVLLHGYNYNDIAVPRVLSANVSCTMLFMDNTAGLSPSTHVSKQTFPSAALNPKYGLLKCLLIRILYRLFGVVVSVFITGNPSPKWGASTGLPDDVWGWLGGDSRAWCSPSREVQAVSMSECTHGWLTPKYYAPSLNQ